MPQSRVATAHRTPSRLQSQEPVPQPEQGSKGTTPDGCMPTYPHQIHKPPVRHFPG